jgi:uncharacterized protein (TIGR03435 family)
MHELDDIALLRQYTEQTSEEAFAALVTRHIDKVYSVALRHTGNPHQAEEITQAVFVILARKSSRLSKHVILEGWLYETARLTAMTFIRSEIRRARREQEAYMQNVLNENETDVWPQIAPLLDSGLAGLKETDRHAVVLRFFYGKSMREIGVALGGSEDTARMRINRALEKLRNFFVKRGIASTTTTLAGAISANSVQAAPTMLAKTTTALALAKGAAASSSTLTLIKGALKIMAWSKVKAAVVVGACVLFAAGTTTVVVEKIVRPKLSSADLSWADDPRYWKTDSRVLGAIPPKVFIFRPTRFLRNGGHIEMSGQMGNRIMEKNGSVQELIETAYGFPQTRTIFPPNLPGEYFDLMSTVPGYHELLQEEIKKRFKLTAHRETREMDALLLKVANSNPPNLKPHGRDGGNQSWIGENQKATITNQRLDNFVGSIEFQLGQPVLNQTGLNDRYDFQINWQPQRGETEKDAFQRALLEQLGLELVPGRQSVEMLVVEKAN